MTIDPQKLRELYLSRPDLQALYNADGTPIDPSNPQVAGIPTLQNWASVYGIKENPDLDPTYSNLSKFFTPEQLSGMPDDVKTGLSAFIDVQTKNFEAGKVNADINAGNWNDAMAAAASDPTIAGKYGDALKTAVATTNQAVQNITQQFTQDAEATQRLQTTDTRQLNENEDAAGRAYSGFRAKAQQKLQADQGNIIKSSLRTLQQNMQSTVRPFESTYGSDALSKLNLPNTPDVFDKGTTAYNPVGDIKGTNDIAKAADTRGLAKEFYDTTSNPTGTT